MNPDGAPYGETIAEASSFSHKFTLQITSINNGLVKGTFTGKGIGELQRANSPRS